MFELLLMLGLVGVVAWGGFWTFRHFTKSSTSSSIVSASTSVAFLTFENADYDVLAAADRAAVSRHLKEISYSDKQLPKADIVFCYCNFNQNGLVRGADKSLKDLISETEAKMFLVASENDGDAYMSACNAPGDGVANLVLTLDRKGKCFGNFFSKLLEQMKSGVPMPEAWVQLAPQGSSGASNEAPETFCAMELGQLVITSQESSTES
jgi:hypothetical protein